MWPFKRRRKPIEELYSLIEDLPARGEKTPAEVMVSAPPVIIQHSEDNPRAQAMKDYETAMVAHQRQIDDLKDAGGG